MRSFLNAKLMAKDLKEALAGKGHALSHSACLELVAKQFGSTDWNTLSAIIERIERRQAPLPAAEGWFSGGMTDPKKIRMGLEPGNPGVALIESLVDRAMEEPAADLFGCLMQSVSAEIYRGQKLKLTAELRATDAGLGTIWMRIDGGTGTVLRFDNMMQRKSDGAISGTTGWTRRSIVLDVPDEAESVHYGFFLRGMGQVRARAFDLTPTDSDVSVPDVPRPRRNRKLPLGPVNLHFLDRQSG
ncbi:glyoxalase superfamily protein [Bosea minatitlanensis]|uniref:Glyoxalase superfamily protein n=1 Tax=Bosea minatitlanensis TaxID=128782 RepID=A0ABW0F7J2_9HYPH|nr:glyoxalase superfamily protein [Bosea minatitlanensis]MCT4495077.1 glyoxalase superfamily protein [Bosea minatitlanensis]